MPLLSLGVCARMICGGKVCYGGANLSTFVESCKDQNLLCNNVFHVGKQ